MAASWDGRNFKASEGKEEFNIMKWFMSFL